MCMCVVEDNDMELLQVCLLRRDWAVHEGDPEADPDAGALLSLGDRSRRYVAGMLFLVLIQESLVETLGR